MDENTTSGDQENFSGSCLKPCDTFTLDKRHYVFIGFGKMKTEEGTWIKSAVYWGLDKYQEGESCIFTRSYSSFIKKAVPECKYSVSSDGFGISEAECALLLFKMDFLKKFEDGDNLEKTI